MKGEPFRRKLVIELPDERFEWRALEPQTERGDAAFEKLLVAQQCPISNGFHPAHGIIEKSAVTLSPQGGPGQWP